MYSWSLLELWYLRDGEQILGEADRKGDGYTIGISIWDRFSVGAVRNTPAWSRYTFHGSLESVHRSLCFALSMESTYGSSRGDGWITGNIREWVYDGRMAKTSSKERGKGPGRGKGRPTGKKDVFGKDGGLGSDSERRRQRVWLSQRW